MSTNPRKYRRKGSLSALRGGLYAMFQRHLEFVEDPDSDHETVVKSSNAAVQIALAYMRVCAIADIEADMQSYESLINGNGHHP